MKVKPRAKECAMSCGLLMVLALLSTQSAWSQIENRQLSQFSTLRGEVVDPEVAADGNHVVYLADPKVARVYELFSVPVGGGAVVQLSPPLMSTGSVLSFELSDDGAQVLFTIRGDGLDSIALYTVPVTGGTPLELSGSMHANGEVRQFAFSPDGQRAVYVADPDTATEINVYSVPILSGASTQLNTVASPVEVLDFEISPDGSRIVYRAEDIGGPGPAEIFSVPIAGGSAIRLNDPLPPGSNRVVGDYLITPDSTQVIFSSQLESTAADLFAVSLMGGATTRLNPAEVGNLSGKLLINPQGTHVVFQTGTAAAFRDLYSLALSDLELHELSDLVGLVVGYGQVELTPDGQSVVFSSRRIAGETTVADLHIASLTTGVAIQLNPDFSQSAINFGDFEVSADSARIAYIANADNSNFDELYAVPASGGMVRKLNPDITAGTGVTEITFDSTGDGVIYLADQDQEEIAEVFTVPWLGGASVQLNQALVEGGTARDFVTDGSQVFFTAEADHLEVTELYQVAESGGVVTKLSEEPTAVAGIVLRVLLNPEETHVVFSYFSADREWLASVALDGESPPRVLTDPVLGERVFEVLIDPLGQRVVYRGERPGEGDNLFSVPLTGGESPTQLNSPLEESVGSFFSITPDGQFVVYRTGLGLSNLWSVPIAGGAIQQLNDVEEIRSWRSSNDGSRIVFEAGELFSTPIRDGMPIQLTDVEVFDFRWDVSPDSSTVAYLDAMDQAMFTVPIDGGATPTEILSTNTGRPNFSPDSQHILYQYSPGALLNLFSIPAAGGSPVQLNDRAQHAGLVAGYRASSDSSRVVMRMVSNSRSYMLASVPLAGGDMQVLDQTSTSQPTNTGILDYLLTPDDTEVVYIVDRADGGGGRLFRAPIDGGDLVRLNPTGNVQAFGLSADGSRAYYTVIQPGETDRTQLVSVPVAGGPAVRMHPPLQPNREVSTFLITSDGQGVIYRADQTADGVFDLYYSRLTGTLFDDGFESGDTSAWSLTSP